MESDENLPQVESPVLPHGTSSTEKSFWPFTPYLLGWAPALPDEAFCRFHVNRHHAPEEVWRLTLRCLFRSNSDAYWLPDAVMKPQA
jgi:hypothetical protein